MEGGSDSGTSYFYPRSPCGERRGEHHASSQQEKFLSTLSLRRATGHIGQTRSKRIFLSTLSLRRATPIFSEINTGGSKFLSTLSLRRATLHKRGCIVQHNSISIHALLAESDRSNIVITSQKVCISIHALLAESDSTPPRKAETKRGFLSTLSLRRATGGGE